MNITRVGIDLAKQYARRRTVVSEYLTLTPFLKNVLFSINCKQVIIGML